MSLRPREQAASKSGPARSVFAAAVLLLCVLCAVAPAARGAAPARAPAAANPELERRIAEAVGKLGSADPAERERATQELWSIGKAAEPALQKVAAGRDPEAASR